MEKIRKMKVKNKLTMAMLITLLGAGSCWGYTSMDLLNDTNSQDQVVNYSVHIVAEATPLTFNYIANPVTNEAAPAMSKVLGSLEIVADMTSGSLQRHWVFFDATGDDTNTVAKKTGSPEKTIKLALVPHGSSAKIKVPVVKTNNADTDNHSGKLYDLKNAEAISPGQETGVYTGSLHVVSWWE